MTANEVFWYGSAIMYLALGTVWGALMTTDESYEGAVGPRGRARDRVGGTLIMQWLWVPIIVLVALDVKLDLNIRRHGRVADDGRLHGYLPRGTVYRDEQPDGSQRIYVGSRGGQPCFKGTLTITATGRRRVDWVSGGFDYVG